MLRIQRGLRNPWLLASQDEVSLTPPRALFILDLMTHGRARYWLLLRLAFQLPDSRNSAQFVESHTLRQDIPKLCWF
jgi:hypothetical protein